MASLVVRTISLIAAYALALHVLILAMTPPVTLAGVATPGVICASATNLDQPAGQDRVPCAPDCTMAGCGAGGWVPPSVDVIAKVTPTELPLSLQLSAQTVGRISHQSPQAPRAPPLA